jgi:flagellar M-ring protein FliF
VTSETRTGGEIQSDSSTVSVAAIRYITYSEDILEEAGELEDTTFDAYKAAHSEPVATDVDDSMIQLVANATGIPAENITFVCYEQPVFVAKETNSRSLNDILQIVLAVLIFILLGYVVFRSTRKQADAEMEPELSVETLLEATQVSPEDEALDNIGYSEKSETRILIEKFVDENPEAAALLLRNWLNDEWE